jgi:hypothetical protein
MRLLAGLLLTLVAGPVLAQEPTATDGGAAPEAASDPVVRLGVFGFSARWGVDFEGAGQALVSVALDVGRVLSDRLRIRPSGEIGLFNGENTYVGNIEMVFRFTPETDIAVPYVGTGVGLAGRGGCAVDPDCPALWLQFALGFEVRFRDQIAWLLEYHPEDAFRRQRVFIGLTTRRGP